MEAGWGWVGVVGRGDREKERRRRVDEGRESSLASPFMFFLHLGLPYANWASPGVLFVLPEVFTLVLGPSFDLPLFYFRGLFPSLSFSHHILDSFSLFYLLNTKESAYQCREHGFNPWS